MLVKVPMILVHVRGLEAEVVYPVVDLYKAGEDRHGGGERRLLKELSSLIKVVVVCVLEVDGIGLTRLPGLRKGCI